MSYEPDTFPYDFSYNQSEPETDSIDIIQEETESDYIGTEPEGDYVWKPFEYGNVNLYVKDCEPDGNCQFRSIETALGQFSKEYTHKVLRDLVIKYILKLSQNRFEQILENYKLEKSNGEFAGGWDPDKINTKEEFVSEMRKGGFHFEGDYTTLEILSNVLDVDFIILNKSKQVTLVRNNKIATIVLYYEKIGNSGHYLTIGLKKNDKIITAFKTSRLPIEIRELINLTKNSKSNAKSPKRSRAKRSRAKSPKRSRAKSPKRSRAKSYKRSRAKLPKRSRAKSPKRSRAKLPKRSRAKRSKSPKRSRAKSHKRSRAKSPKRSRAKRSKSPKRSRAKRSKSPKRH